MTEFPQHADLAQPPFQRTRRHHGMNTTAVLLARPDQISLADLAAGRAHPPRMWWWMCNGAASPPAPSACCGPAPCRSFPGMGYPLVPGYESVGRVVAAGEASGLQVGQQGSSCPAPTASARWTGSRCAACSAARPRAWWCQAARVIAVDEALGEQAVLLALAATAYHAVSDGGRIEHVEGTAPDRRPRRTGPPAGAAERGCRLPRHRGLGDATRCAPRAPRATPCCTPTPTRAATTTSSATSAATPRCSTR